MASELKKQIIDLLEKDKEFRYIVAGLIGFREVLDELRELRKKGEEHDRKFNEILGRLREHDEKFNEMIARLEEHSKRFEEHDRKFNEILAELKSHREKLEKHDWKFDTLIRRLDALGSRWGLLAENAFREGMKGIVEEYFKGKVEKWIYEDKEGFVFGYPSTVDVDLVIRNGEYILIEVKSSISKGDLAVLVRKGELYEKVKGVKPKLAVISPYVDEKALKDAKKLGIAVYTE
ncbi:hypothetical protein DRO97_08895 [Archaeoglobales archaeon]|nr:MAG: hypothetical protein DRO97_08895 [Archaeoglobales archaeon]